MGDEGMWGLELGPMEKLVLACVMDNAAATKALIGQLTGLSRSTVHRAVKGLKDMGLLSGQSGSDHTWRYVAICEGMSERHRCVTVKPHRPSTPPLTDKGTPLANTVNTIEAPLEPLDLQGTINEPIEPPLVPPRPSRRARISPGWQPGRDLVDSITRLLNVRPEDVASEVDGFRDYWLSKGEPRADWSASFRNWCRNGVKFGRLRTRGNKTTTSRLQKLRERVLVPSGGNGSSEPQNASTGLLDALEKKMGAKDE